MRTYENITVTEDFHVIGVRGKELKGRKDEKGYILLKVHGVNVRRSHVIARCFPEICGEWFEGAEVHHKDRNKTNDVPTNLQIVSHKEHVLIHIDDHPSHEAWNKGLPGCFSELTRKKMSESAKKRGSTHSKPVRATKNNIVTEYVSAAEASRQLGVNFRYISACCNGEQATAGGYKFEFV